MYNIYVLPLFCTALSYFIYIDTLIHWQFNDCHLYSSPIVVAMWMFFLDSWERSGFRNCAITKFVYLSAVAAALIVPQLLPLYMCTCTCRRLYCGQYTSELRRTSSSMLSVHMRSSLVTKIKLEASWLPLRVLQHTFSCKRAAVGPHLSWVCSVQTGSNGHRSWVSDAGSQRATR